MSICSPHHIALARTAKGLATPTKVYATGFALSDWDAMPNHAQGCLLCFLELRPEVHQGRLVLTKGSND